MTNHRPASANEIADGLANLGGYLYQNEEIIAPFTVEIVEKDVVVTLFGGNGAAITATILFFTDHAGEWVATVSDDTQAGGVAGDRVPGLVAWQADIAWAKDVVRGVIEAVKENA